MQKRTIRAAFEYILLFPTLFVSLPSYGQSQAIDSALESREIIGIEQRLMDAIPGGDTSTWSRYLDAQFFVVTEDGSRLSRAEFIAGMHPLPPGFSGYIRVIHPKVIFNGRTAVINYVSDEYEYVFGQTIHTSYSSMNTYVQRSGKWRMISSLVFEVPQLPLPIHVSRNVQKKYTGVYELNDTISCKVTLEHDTLYIYKNGRMRDALSPETDNVFFRMADSRGRKVFVKGDDGAMLMRERRNGQDIVWKRISR